MIISASTLREQSEANLKAKEERLYKETADLANKVAKRVREMVEEKIVETAAKGKFTTGVFRLGYSKSYGGMVKDALFELTGDNRIDCRIEGALRKRSKTPRWTYVYDLWEAEVDELLGELADNGYVVEGMDGNPHRHSDELYRELAPEYFVTNYMIISW